MTDRELLERAAKAAGIEHGGWLDYHPRFHNGCFLVKGTPWNPLTDDGDALRLAVKLSMQITDRVWCPNKTYSHGSENGVSMDFENYNNGPDAATRRAIVRAAAEIGRNIK